jgi:hypothetical protein
VSGRAAPSVTRQLHRFARRRQHHAVDALLPFQVSNSATALRAMLFSSGKPIDIRTQ